MKTTISKLKYVFFLLVIAGLFSCKGEIGPPGADGTNGTNGIDGIDGTNGTDGNANVTSSAWLTPTWSATLPAISAYFYYATDDITEDIINNGVVLSYTDYLGDGEQVYSVPFTFGTSYSISHYFRLSLGNIDWRFIASTAHTPPTGQLFRYVIIPSSGSKSADSQQAIYDELDNAGVDISKYEEVMDYYGLKY